MPMPLDYTLPFGLSLAAAALGAALLLALTLTHLGHRLLRRPWRPRPRLRRAGLALLLAGPLAAWTTARCKGATLEHGATDLAMLQAPRPPRDWRQTIIPPAPYLLLAGDLHCHINPPDWADHVARHLPETLRLAQQEQLDFVSLVPHVFSDFPATPSKRARVVKMLEELQARVDARPEDGLILDVGVEYTDPTGHFGMVLGDVPAALASLPATAGAKDFVNAFADRGGLLVVNHPLLTPIPSPVPLSSLDISWQPFTGKPPFRPEIAAVDARADAFEAANLFVRSMRDRFLLDDSEDSTRRTLAVLDREIVARQRRMTPVGGTDSHSFHLRPMTFLLAGERSRDGIRDAIRAGRTCVVQPGACTFEVRTEGGAFAPVGSSLVGATRVEVRASGEKIAVYRNGERVGAPGDGQVIAVDVPPGECSVLRATVDGGYSAPVYVNCPFASRGR